MNGQRQVEQMTLDVGGDPDEPIMGSYKIAGTVAALKELPRRAECTVQIVGPDGEVVAAGPAFVKSIAFPTHSDDLVHWTERAHTVKFGEDA